MGRPYSMDLRQRAMDRLALGESCRSVASTLKVAPSSVIKWAQRQHQTGSAAPGKMGGYRPLSITGSHRDWVLSMIEGPDHVTLQTLVAGLSERGLKVHLSSIARFLHREGKSFKKSVLPSEQNRPKVARHRDRWKRYQDKIDPSRLVFPAALCSQPPCVPSRLVFIDETWVKTNMAPLRGWGRRGMRLVAHAPHGHWRTMTFVAALRCDRIDAPWVLNGPINANAFLTYVEK